jgi:hypothetical protein
MITTTTYATQSRPLRRLASILLLTLTLTAASAAGLASPARAATPLPPYGWPVEPFGAPHPVRGNFGDPRTRFTGGPSRRTLLRSSGLFSFHFGVDVSAPNGTAVYPVESGIVVSVPSGRDKGYVEVAGANGRSFEYWHIDCVVQRGQRVEARKTVLGRILKPRGHVHLAEFEHGVFVNPLLPGHLAPYDDTARPTVASVSFRRTDDGARLAPRRLAGRVEILASAFDFPSVPVPGAWHALPVTPTLLTWSIRSASGRTVAPRRVAFDVRHQLPASDSFWRVYARGTHQNMSVYGTHYAYKEPGVYLFRLGADGLDTRSLPNGAYELVVTATDIRGNHGSLVQAFAVRNA